ncbi:acyl-CoA dehydrogenase C-terminal domain-containing protein [Candidatus Skiveiella danica]|jgi:alkylation response protein AidB-like acyl-CoA dehydrogenase|uniref:acyl-CoA dehydrogenase C-terminal domain-containing protein n=1 Tax=Candidatus Skiveiella danica TaxID=3386177 RepID=UPI001B5C015B|nr:acyl-CoA dehydrogenase C-terminal domain-containing protein [Comamonadaceae bacterium]MBK9198236.1 acyl-CoA dehydrogenase C-terminal domain-containing protein [Betaproteobacteria bacterium]MBP8101016.1 acyl-CoA dehydrogenase C-terminal domain-containing protein [Burkholderiaceae bacterium]
MTQYKAPLRDMRFLMNEVLDYPAHYASLPNGKDADPEMVDAILDGAAQLCEDVLAPLNHSGDIEGCHFDNGAVTTPKGFKEAYRQFVEGGWQGLSFPTEFGGQGLPMSLNLFKSEMMGTANWSFAMYPGLSVGCINTLMQYGSKKQKAQYIPKLVSGEWAGTMCLTEPQCGTDLAQVKTRAVPQKGGSYKITGTKIFISAGEHDLTENIVHIVLARLPDAPEGTRGISLFVVPKFKVKADGTLGERNAVNCGSIEHKMGIRASSTAVLNFDEAEGFMVFEPNRGLEAMFTFMNTARLGTAVQGVCHAEAAFQGALPYAKDRRSMRALSGKKDPESKADALIWHPDVRRMLLTQKAIAEGGRAMIYDALKIGDHMFNASAAGDAEGYKAFDSKLGFYTPILKGFLTEMGLEAANLGVQVFGGHGYIKEHGMEQIVRDARISTLYEGTTGIQALDLLGRKVLMGSKGKCVRDFTLEMVRFARPHLLRRTPLGAMARNLAARAAEWNLLTTAIMLRAPKDREVVGAASVDYLMYSGFVMMGYYWAGQAAKAEELLASGQGKESEDFYRSKVQTAEFYFERLMPRANAHRTGALAPTRSVMQLDNEHFAFA